jgi:hypothetical protein
MLIDDETINALRRVCDCHFEKFVAGEIFERPEHLPSQFVREIVACLPNGIIERVSPAALGTDSHLLTVRINPMFNAYVAFAAEYLLVLCLGHRTGSA